MSLTRTPTAMRSSSETSLQRLINELRYDQRLPAQIECSYANELCQNIEEQANEEEDCAERDRLLEFVGTSRKVLGIALSRKDGSSRSSMFLDGDNKVEGKQLVLRDGKQSVHSSPVSSLSEKRQCQPVHPTPVHSARVDQDDGTQCDFDRPPSMARSNDVQNPTNGQGRSQTLEDPSATNFLTNSAPIFNQNVNSGSGQQNIEVNGDFEVLPSYTPTTAPREYEAPFVFERNELRGSGLQRADASRDIINQTAGNDRRGGYSQTLKGPHGRTHLRTMAPVYNQNINSGDGQQNIDVKGRMGFQKQSFKEPSRQGLGARHSSQTSAQSQPLAGGAQPRQDQRFNGHESGQASPARYRSRSPSRVDLRSRGGFVASRPYSPNRHDGYRDNDCEDRHGHVRSSRRRSRSPTRVAPYSRGGSMVSRPSSPRRYNSRRDDEYDERYSSRRDDDDGGRYKSRRDDGYEDGYGPRRDDHHDRYSRGHSVYDNDSHGTDYGTDYGSEDSSDYR